MSEQTVIIILIALTLLIVLIALSIPDDTSTDATSMHTYPSGTVVAHDDVSGPGLDRDSQPNQDAAIDDEGVTIDDA